MLIKYHKERIDINPFPLSGNLYPLIDSGTGSGSQVENTAGVPVVTSYDNPVRISFQKKWIEKRNDARTPVSIEKRVYCMISDNTTMVAVRLEFIYHGISLKVMQRKELRKYNTLIGYEYELKNLTEDNFYG